jgi:hypothetical protein
MLTNLVDGYEKGKIANQHLIWLSMNNPLWIGHYVGNMLKDAPSKRVRYSAFITGIVSAVISLYIKDRIARAFMFDKEYERVSLWNKPNPFKPELN